jgi:hypothetical protein
MVGNEGLPGRILKLMFEDPYDGEPSSYILLAASYSIFSCSAWARKGYSRRISHTVCHLDHENTYLTFSIGHGTPFGCGEHALFGGFGLIAKNLLHQLWVCPDPLEEHKVSAKRFLWRIWIFDVALPRFPSLSLRSPKGVLAFDVIRCQGSHVSGELPLASFLRGLGTPFIGLERRGR